MKDVYKNPILYYIVVPVVIALWPLLIWGVYLPKANDALNLELNDYKKAEDIMLAILNLDRDRLKLSDPNSVATEFGYATAIERVASSCKIPSTNYKLSATSKGQKSQDCHVELKQVGIVQFAEFLSTIQLRWANLQCERLKLTKEKGLPDMWKVDLDFKYYY